MSQLAWPQILSVALRLKVSEALLLTGHTLDIYSSDEHSLALLNEFHAIAAGELAIAGRSHRTPADAAEEGPAIDAYLKRVGDALKNRTARLAAKSAHAKRLLEAIAAACGSAMCHACSGANACAWTTKSSAADERRMASGECMRSVRELFAWICNVVAQRYEQAGVRDKAVAPRLLTGHGCRNTDLELAIKASTHDGLEHGARDIKMIFDPDSLWVTDYLSLAYVFAHECAAHAWCGADIDAPEAEESKVFHEGWMDAVAAAILSTALTDQALAPPAHAKEMWSQTRIVRAMRLCTSRACPPADVWEWNKGVRAFETLQYLFTQTLSEELEEGDDQWNRASAEAQKWAVDLSLRINASGISHSRRAGFAQAILQHFARSSRAASANALARSPQAIEFAREYTRMHDEEKFVEQIVAIRR